MLYTNLPGKEVKYKIIMIIMVMIMTMIRRTNLVYSSCMGTYIVNCCECIWKNAWRGISCNPLALRNLYFFRNGNGLLKRVYCILSIELIDLPCELIKIHKTTTIRRLRFWHTERWSVAATYSRDKITSCTHKRKCSDTCYSEAFPAKCQHTREGVSPPRLSTFSWVCRWARMSLFHIPSCITWTFRIWIHVKLLTDFPPCLIWWRSFQINWLSRCSANIWQMTNI